ncbi:GTP-binding protein [Patescibacteria group bacterium]|nr:GTP-binding protein [Patescibacteria group bacterium]
MNATNQKKTHTQIPATIFSGFLGSGKTTIISNLIDELQSQNQQVIYIKNEIGDTDIDGKVMEGKGIKTKELLNGCICCTLVGPFITSINEVIESFSPDRIIIEASGAADPSAIALMISSHPKLDRDGVVGIIDVVNFDGYKDLSITTQNQTKFTDLIIFNKIELVDINKKKAVVGYVRELNTHSPIIEAPNGKVPAKLIFGLNSKDLSAILEDLKASDSNHSYTDHIHEDNIQSFNLNPEGKFNKDELEETINKTPKNIFRIKGFVKLEDDKFYLLNSVGKRTDFVLLETEKNTPEYSRISENLLIFIGFMVHDYKHEVKESIDAIAKK